MEPIRVCMLVLNNYTHDARVHKEAKTLAAAGHDVRVMALWQVGLPTEETHDGYRTIRLPLRSRAWRGTAIAPVVKYLEFTWRVWRLAAREPARVYHAHDANTLPAAWLASRRTHAGLVYDAHELETGRSFASSRLANIYQRIWAWPERAFIRKADAVLTVSEGIAEELVRLYAISRPTIVLNCPEQRTEGRSRRLREELGIPSDLKIALFQGRVSPGRSIETFLEAVQDLPDTAGVILGDGPLLAELRSRVQSGDWQRVYLPGQVPNAILLDYTASADVGVSLGQATCPSHRLALPNKLFEYLQAGIPIVVSDLPERARLAQEYRIGEIVNPDDPRSIADGLRRLLHDPERYAQARANVSRAAALFNWEQESRKLVEVYSRFAQNAESMHAAST